MLGQNSMKPTACVRSPPGADAQGCAYPVHGPPDGGGQDRVGGEPVSRWASSAEWVQHRDECGGGGGADGYAHACGCDSALRRGCW